MCVCYIHSNFFSAVNPLKNYFNGGEKLLRSSKLEPLNLTIDYSKKHFLFSRFYWISGGLQLEI